MASNPARFVKFLQAVGLLKTWGESRFEKSRLRLAKSRLRTPILTVKKIALYIKYF